MFFSTHYFPFQTIHLPPTRTQLCPPSQNIFVPILMKFTADLTKSTISIHTHKQVDKRLQCRLVILSAHLDQTPTEHTCGFYVATHIEVFRLPASFLFPSPSPVCDYHGRLEGRMSVSVHTCSYLFLSQFISVQRLRPTVEEKLHHQHPQQDAQHDHVTVQRGRGLHTSADTWFVEWDIST